MDLKTRTTLLASLAAFAVVLPAHAAVTDLPTVQGSIIASTTSAATLPFYDVGMAVVNQGAANTLGGLTFIYQINNSFYDPVTITGAVLNGFNLSGLQTNLAYTTTFDPTNSSGSGLSSLSNPFVTGTAAPTSAADSSSITYNFSDKTNKSTELLVVQTNATGYTTTTDTVKPNVGNLVSSYKAYAPTLSLVSNATPAPEPSPLAVFACVGLGLLFLTARARRRGVVPMMA